MKIDPPEAAAALDDIDRIVARVKQSEIYRTAGMMLVMWGAIVACGYVAAFMAPRNATAIWLALQFGGVVATTVMTMRTPRGRPRHFDFRPAGAMALFFGFGLIWAVLLGHFGPREMNAFWATLFMFGYTLAGLWFGRAFIVLGLTITALTIAGYLWAGPWFEPYMAVVDGGGIALCGLWMRRA